MRISAVDFRFFVGRGRFRGFSFCDLLKGKMFMDKFIFMGF